jgi:hypothetical protein
MSCRSPSRRNGRKKKLQVLIEREKEAEVARIVARLQRESSIDLEAMEFYIRGAVLQIGARALEGFLAGVGRGRRVQPLLCADNHLVCQMESIGLREKTIRTILGEVRFKRSGYRCPVCGATRYPGDEALDVEGTGFSPGVRRMMAYAGGDMRGFRTARKMLELCAALRLDPKDVERVSEETGRIIEDWAARERSLAVAAPPLDETPDIVYVTYDATGAPIRKEELREAKGKGEDGKARTREVKLGCVFTQTGTDEEGRPVRDENSTTYVGAIEPSMDFGHRIYAEAVRRGLLNARRVVILMDAIAYNKSIASEHFSNATVIIDLYHAREHLAAFVRDVLRQKLTGPLHQSLRGLLDTGEIGKLVAQMEKVLPRNGPRRAAGRKQTAYFRNNAPYMRYAEFRREGLFVGSGVIEAGCKTVVGWRLKNSGMFWSVRGANAIVALRCCILSDRFEQFWESRCERRAA